MIPIQLTEAEALAFKLFREHQDNFMLLVENRVFDLRNGTAEIHFNPGGQIAAIDLHAKVFRRVSVVVEAVDIVKKTL